MEQLRATPPDNVSDDDLKQFVIDFIGWNQQDVQYRLNFHMMRLGIHNEFVSANIVTGWLRLVFKIHMPISIGVDKAERECSAIARLSRTSLSFIKLGTGRGGFIEGYVAFQLPVPKGADLILNLQAMRDIYALSDHRRSSDRDR
jgi:hypothetical protein